MVATGEMDPSGSTGYSDLRAVSAGRAVGARPPGNRPYGVGGEVRGACSAPAVYTYAVLDRERRGEEPA